jgi:hypothetical protein
MLNIPPTTDGALLLWRVCKILFNGQSAYLKVKRMMRIRPKVKALLPKIVEAIISIEIDSLERQ